MATSFTELLEEIKRRNPTSTVELQETNEGVGIVAVTRTDVYDSHVDWQELGVRAERIDVTTTCRYRVW